MEFLPLEHVRGFARSGRLARWASYSAILLGALVLNLDGIGRSLWLDEAWVANSVHQPTLGGMFYYPEWLQTSPPLFLLLARGATNLFEFSTIYLRLIPLLFALLAAVAMLAVARRVVAAPLGLMAATLLVFHPLPVEYFRSFKQYGAEMAATAVLLLFIGAYLKALGRREFIWLVGATCLLLPLSYPLAFLLPGIVIALWKFSPKRAMVYAATAAVIVGVLYAVFVRPNVAPVLWTYWGNGADPQYGGGAIPIVLVSAAALYGMWRVRSWTLFICVLPCALLLLAEVSGWYPASPRTRLFVRPCFLLALAIVANDLYARVASRWMIVSVAVTLASIVLMGWGLLKQFNEGRGEPHEDYIAAIDLLRENLRPGDTLLVHPAAREGFRLYAEIENWHPAVIYGDTGWPCCARGHVTTPRSSTEALVKKDLDAKIPLGTSGRVWMLYPDRSAHWDYTGVSEGDLWRRLLAERGCLPGLYVRHLNLVVHERVCPAGHNFP